MAPLAVTCENGYLEDEGLYVTLEAQANRKVLFDGVIDGQLDGAHMPGINNERIDKLEALATKDVPAM